MLTEVVSDHLSEQALEELSEMTQATIYQVSRVSFRDPQIFYSQSYLLSTRVSFWRKIWALMGWYATPTLSIASAL
jgi:hypothetical protein